MATVTSVNVDKNITMLEHLEKIIPYSAHILLQEQMGLPTNTDRVKNARFTIASFRSLKTLEKETRKVNMAERRFNFNVLETYGSEADKKEVKKLLGKKLKEMKFIE